jgi:hypothetical protein
MPVQVIDLTGSSPPAAGPSRQPVPPPLRPRPRGREVIDVDALPDTPPERARLPNGDDIGLVFARAGPRPPGRRFQPREPPPPRPVEPHAFPGFIPGPRFYQDAAQEDPILGHGGRIGQRSADMGPNAIFYGHRLHRGLPGGGGPSSRANLYNAMAGRRGFQPPGQPGFRSPNMDYTAQAPGILRPNTPPVDAAALRNADYKTPPPPKDGFTRTPKETDVLVCANCDQELGVEADTPQAGQVWAGKCGHVSLPPAGVSCGRHTNASHTVLLRKLCDWISAGRRPNWNEQTISQSQKDVCSQRLHK